MTTRHEHAGPGRLHAGSTLSKTLNELTRHVDAIPQVPTVPALLRQLNAARAQLSKAIDAAIVRAAMTGTSWDDVGEALSITPDAARQRFLALQRMHAARTHA